MNVGYAGVAVLSRVEPRRVQYGFGDPNLDDEARLLTVEYSDFVLVNLYVPYSGSRKRTAWDSRLFSHLDNLSSPNKPLIVCGDFNVSLSDLDVADRELRPGTAGLTAAERFCMGRLLGLHLVDSFRILHSESVNEFSFWRYGGDYRGGNFGWRLDYFLISPELCSLLINADILSTVLGSDHCPVTLTVKIF